MDKSSSSTASITTLFGTRPHQLKLGRSFDGDKHRAFHTIRYDFKPASVDLSKEAVLEVGEGHEVNITLPNVESKGTTCTKFKGSKRPLQKECVLIYDHRTGEFTLEKLTCNMQVKKQREEGTSKAQLGRPLGSLDTATNLKNSTTSTSSKSKKADLSSSNAVLSAPDIDHGGEISPLQPSPLAPSPHTPPSHLASSHHDDSDSSSSYMTDSESDDNDEKRNSASSSSDEDSQGHNQAARNGNLSRKSNNGNWRIPHTKTNSPPRPRQLDPNQDAQYLRSQLSQDLQLSESDSDSD